MSDTMMKKTMIQAISVHCLVVLLIVSLSGCTSDEKTTGTVLNGVWVGDGGLVLSAGRGNSSVTQVSFEGSTVALTMTSEQGTMMMNYTYTVAGNTILLQPSFTGGGMFPGGQPGNWTMPPNGTRPEDNGTRPPMNNGSWPSNGTGPGNMTGPSNSSRPPSGARPSMTLSLQFSISEDRTLLFLNGYVFTRFQ